MATNTGLQFTVRVAELPPESFAVVDFTLHEKLNEPFILTLNLACAKPDIDFAAVLDKRCELKIWYNSVLQRQTDGMISEFSQGETGFRRTRYQAVVRPVLWRASLRHNSRIFQDQTPQEILDTLLKENKVLYHAYSLRHSHVAREYCVQYRETDLEFISRLAAEEGMFFFHEFGDKPHCLVFADHPDALDKWQEPLFFNPSSHGLEQGPYIRRFSYREAVRTAETVLQDHTFKNPAYELKHSRLSSDLAHQDDSYQYYGYPGRFKQDPSGKAFTGFQLDALRADAVTAEGQSNCAALMPGVRFTLSEHPNPAMNVPWQITGITHQGRQPQALEEESGDEGTVYFNQFHAISGTSVWRTMAKKPVVDGPQTATVTGMGSEEIFCDGFGRVHVKFPWDRSGHNDAGSSCWVRVSQGWAGAGYGIMAIPRVGHEVVVSFLEGDPDQPLITGRTHHALNRVPDLLPNHKTRTLIRTKTPGGSGFNELRFEDLPEREQIYLHAEKNLDEVINEYQRSSVGKDQHLTVEQDQFTRIKQHCHHSVGKDLYQRTERSHHWYTGGDLVQKVVQSVKRLINGGEITRMEGSRQTTLGGSDELLIGAHQRTLVSTDSYLKATDIVLEAGQSLTIRASGGFIKIDSSGITISGDKVRVNEGGSPGSGQAPVSVTPDEPAEPSAPQPPDRR